MSATLAHERNWTEVGADYVARLGQDAVEREIDGLDWQTVPENSSLTVGFMPGAAINAAIEQLGLPRVTAVAISAFERPAIDPDEDGWYPGFYGIEANYGNGRARVYVLDTGADASPLLSDFWPKGES